MHSNFWGLLHPSLHCLRGPGALKHHPYLVMKWGSFCEYYVCYTHNCQKQGDKIALISEHRVGGATNFAAEEVANKPDGCLAGQQSVHTYQQSGTSKYSNSSILGLLVCYRIFLRYWG